MISRDLVDLLNSGEAVAVIGSGVSSDAGLPTWRELFTQIAAQLDHEGHDTKKARDKESKYNYPEAFNILSSATSRSDIHARVRHLINNFTSPGQYHHMLADWPFRLIITLNYDHLLERASSGGTLISVGNRGKELPKVSASMRDLVWHMHGSSELPEDVSQLVITQSDYDDFYPTSNVVERLKAITSLYRCVFIGFGFNDKDFSSILEAVGRVAHSGRPSFALVGYRGQTRKSQMHQDQIRTRYNVEVIPYFKQGSDHTDLKRILDCYNSFVVGRSCANGRATSHATPSYDPLATSLRIQSTLDIGELTTKDYRIGKTILGARVLAHVREHPGDPDSLSNISQAGVFNETEILECLSSLRSMGLVTPAPMFELTEKHHARTEEANTQLQIVKDRYKKSLQNRTDNTSIILDSASRSNVSSIVSDFFDNLCRQRGLGVAQNLATSDTSQATIRTTSLIQQLPEYLNQCKSRDEALATVEIASDVLTAPNEVETTYLGLICQAYFGQHLVHATDRLAQLDQDLISDTCYLLDASVIICLLAEEADTYEFTVNLLRDLQARNAILVTTDLFIREIIEHANWPLNLVNSHGEDSSVIIAALRCLGDYRPNQFLRGYFLGSPPDHSFAAYIARIFSSTKTGKITSDIAETRLQELKIYTLRFEDWVGFNQSFLEKRADLSDEIQKRRVGKGTYKKPVQTKAEAEVALIVDGLRRNLLQPPGSLVKDAFFLSSTRVVDGLPSLVRRICLLPDGLAQWLWSSQAVSPKCAEMVFEQMLWDLAQSGIEFVDNATILRKFSGVVEASKTEINAAIRDRRDFLVQKYGPDPAQAFSDVDPLDLPRYATELHEEVLQRMEQELLKAKQREKEARSAASLDERDRYELAKLRQREKQRKKKADRKLRAAKSRSSKKKKRT